MPFWISMLLLVHAAPDVPVQVALGQSGESCTLRIDGSPAAQESLQSLATQWARVGRAVEITGDASLPYRCIGGTLFALQVAGFDVSGPIGGELDFRVTMTGTVKLGIAPGCGISVNDAPATFAEYEELAVQWGRNQPDIHLLPDPSTEYECVYRVLEVLKAHNATKLGFVGNEQFSEEDLESDPLPDLP